MLAFSLIVIGILLRFSPHAPNFTPVAAIALFSGAYLNRRYRLLVPLSLMIVSDMFLGFHNVIPFTWGCFILITILGNGLKKQKSLIRVTSLSIISSFLFYIITNFGVWLMGWYPQNLKGLVTCYIMALPFLRNFTLATLIYTAVFFGVYEFIAARVRNTKYSRVLLAE
jgi:hypothetical protein